MIGGIQAHLSFAIFPCPFPSTMLKFIKSDFVKGKQRFSNSTSHGEDCELYNLPFFSNALRKGEMFKYGCVRKRLMY